MYETNAQHTTGPATVTVPDGARPDLETLAGLLGKGWYVARETPGAPDVCWLELPGLRIVGVAPMPQPNAAVDRWVIVVQDESGEPEHQDDTLPVDGSTPEQVAEHVRRYLAEHGITA